MLVGVFIVVPIHNEIILMTRTRKQNVQRIGDLQLYIQDFVRQQSSSLCKLVLTLILNPLYIL